MIKMGEMTESIAERCYEHNECDICVFKDNCVVKKINLMEVKNGKI